MEGTGQQATDDSMTWEQIELPNRTSTIGSRLPSQQRAARSKITFRANINKVLVEKERLRARKGRRGRSETIQHETNMKMHCIEHSAPATLSAVVSNSLASCLYVADLVQLLLDTNDTASNTTTRVTS